MNWQEIENQIEQATQLPFKVKSAQSKSGGSINSAYKLQGDEISYFVKLNRGALLPMFEAELEGLEEMAESQTIRVPRGIACGTYDGESFLILEHIDLGSGGSESDRLLGLQLAQLHRTKKKYFGWRRDNTIGSTPQVNNASGNWIEFWRDHRIGFQLQLAERNGFGSKIQKSGERLCDSLDAFFSSHQPEPSLLHGDLWAGNAAVDDLGQPVIFDPACYYGDREADLAMTELFGGFGADFYAAYDEAYPLDPGYKTRKKLYNLYHILNHANLFGGGYLGQAERITEGLLAELR